VGEHSFDSKVTLMNFHNMFIARAFSVLQF